MSSVEKRFSWSKELNLVYNISKGIESMRRKVKDEILRLRAEGKSYKQIHKIVGGSSGTIAYHCGPGQKEKCLNKNKLIRQKRHPLHKKIETFYRVEYVQPRIKNKTSKCLELIRGKLTGFFERKYKMRVPEGITVEKLLAKFGEEPKCYLTGKSIDLLQPRTYSLDHIVPSSKGGQNTVENMGLCTKTANWSKSDMLLEEYIELCKSVLQNFGYNVEKNVSVNEENRTLFD